MPDGFTPVAVSRRIGAPASDIFAILTDPGRHPDLDGSEMLRGAVTTARITGLGDIFVMKMHFPALGDYEMNNYVVEYEQDRRVGWEPAPGRGHPREGQDRWGHRWSYQLTPDGPEATVVTEIYNCSRAPEDQRRGMENGKVWIGAMTKTLERLDKLSTITRLLGDPDSFPHRIRAKGTGSVHDVIERCGVWSCCGDELVNLAQAGPGEQRLLVGDPLAACGQHRVRRLRCGLGDEPGALGQPTVRSVVRASVAERPLCPAPPDARCPLA
jgi:hypothetical protein